MRISDWSSDVCSSDLELVAHHRGVGHRASEGERAQAQEDEGDLTQLHVRIPPCRGERQVSALAPGGLRAGLGGHPVTVGSTCDASDMMRHMPGTNLTRDEAQTRASLISVESYTVDLALSAPIAAGSTFASPTTSTAARLLGKECDHTV